MMDGIHNAQTERHLAEQRAREEEKAARARERAEQLKGKEESKAKLREDLAAHMAAHAAQVRVPLFLVLSLGFVIPLGFRCRVSQGVLPGGSCCRLAGAHTSDPVSSSAMCCAGASTVVLLGGPCSCLFLGCTPSRSVR